METKVCTKCKRELPTSLFGIARKNKDGLNCWCKECCSEANRKINERKREMFNQLPTSTLKRIYENPELARFTPRQLIEELRARGYKGQLTYEQKITL